MKKLFLVALVALVAFAAACGGGGGGEESAAPATSAAPAAAPVDAATAGAINGKITFDGAVPDQGTIQMAADPNCAKLHSAPVGNEFVVVGADGGLQNAFVYVKDGLGDRRFDPPTDAVVLDQHGCMYVPHVIGIQVGQTLTVKNSDATLHNIHAMPKNNKEFNIGQPVQGLTTDKVFDNVEVMVPFKCDVHKWMNSYAGVLDHPYFAVSGEDGSFSIDNLPPGDYVVEVWQEQLGTQEMNVTVGESETAEANFTFAADE